MTSDKPLVSIVITSFNYAHYIGQTIESVLAQTYDNWELIISDDGSTDNSLEVIGSFNDPRIRVIASTTNEGGAAAYARAYALCQGKYFSSLDSDDYFAPDKIEKQVRYLEDNPEIDILGTFITEIDAAGQILTEGINETWFNQTLDLNQPDPWIWKNHICHSSVIIYKSFHDRVGLTNKDLPYTADYEFWLRCLINDARFHILPEKLTYYRSHSNNVTHKNPNRAFLEHVYIFCIHLKPYLFRLHRSDLVHKSISSFLMHNKAYREAGQELKTNILRNLLSIETQTQDFKAFLKSIQNPPEAEWLVIAEVFDIVITVLQDSVKACYELEKGKAWLDEQNHNCQTIIRKQTDQIKELQARIMELEKGKEWLEEQYQHWQIQAQRQVDRNVKLEANLASLQAQWFIRLGRKLGLLTSNQPPY